MKSVFIFAFLGLSLQSALAVSPFEAVVEEWEVSIHIFFTIYSIASNFTQHFVDFRPGSSNTTRFMNTEPMRMLFQVKKKASG